MGTRWTCVYCGKLLGTQEGPDDSLVPSMDDVLKAHVLECREHPLFAARAEIRALEDEIELCPAVGHHTQPPRP